MQSWPRPGVRIRAELADQALGAALVRNQEAAITVAVASELPDRIAVGNVLVLERNMEDVAELARSTEGPGTSELMIEIGSGEPLFDGPYFERSSPTENMYRISGPSSAFHLPWRPMALSVQVLLQVDEVEIVRTMPVTGYVSRLPYGFLARRVEILPDLSVSISPGVRVPPDGRCRRHGGDAGARACRGHFGFSRCGHYYRTARRLDERSGCYAACVPEPGRGHRGAFHGATPRGLVR